MIKRYDLYIDLPTTGSVVAAELGVIEEANRVDVVGVRYRSEYLEHPHAIALDPANMPLDTLEYQWERVKGLPAVLDDYLPDRWGRSVLNKVALYRDKKRLNSNSVIDTLSLLGPSVIGAVNIVPKGEPGVFESGSSIDMLALAEQAAQDVDNLSVDTATLNEMSLLHLANHGSGVGGARPKALVYDQNGTYLAKFNRHSDSYNNARVELACLRMAKAAGIDCFDGTVKPGINGREVLLLNRFDVTKDGHRHHLITANGLLKEPETLADPGQAFRYDDIHGLLQLYSTRFTYDCQQLVKVMLFNRAIHNTDDHERNFSLINDGQGYRLSPAYDMVPTFDRGAYHLAGFGYSLEPPRPTEALKLTRLLGLRKHEIIECAEAVIDAVEHWQDYADQAGVSEEEAGEVSRLIRI
ncbi:type II toxin-antitoxin system HipA family toxin [Gilvimarinus agarilyticus]|uniref:type II toxin-antitoxin system HipA family toxin n=1 Tax=Gilvimarinus agarilyticus TaxID=679259 RepID=UPI0005A2E142|nr:type II toxin-antitoxin system HipA family toxin [Gilvimarinus agarilyticus]